MRPALGQSSLGAVSETDDSKTPDAAVSAAADPEVLTMQRCLDAGDHAEARAIAARLARSDDATKSQAGRTMLACFAPDPGATAAFIVTGGLIVMLAVHWLGH